MPSGESGLDIVAVLSAAFSGMALVVSVGAAYLARQVTTGDFQAVEKVKTDTAKLIATLRATILKGVMYTQQERTQRDDPSWAEFISTEAERKAIEEFMLSSTALAYHSLVAKKSKAARDANVQGEEWRVFFLVLGDL